MSAALERLLQALTGGPTRRLVPVPVPVGARPRRVGHRR